MLYPYQDRVADSNAMKSFRCNLQDEGVTLGNEDSDLILIEAFGELSHTTLYQDLEARSEQALIILCDSGFSKRIGDIPTSLQHRVFLAYAPAATLRVREVVSEAFTFIQHDGRHNKPLPQTWQNWKISKPLIRESAPDVTTLIVDDNKLNRDIIAMFIKRRGYTWSEAQDGQSAVDIFKEKGPSYFKLILMDVQM